MLGNHSDGILTERGFVDHLLSGKHSDAEAESEWISMVEFVRNVQRHGGAFFDVSTWDVKRGREITPAARRWLAATYLIANQKAFAIFLRASKGDPHYGQLQPTYREFVAAKLVGAAVSEPERLGGEASGVWRRVFANGLVLANPSGESRTVPLPDGQQFTDISGTSMTGKVLLAPRNGTVLVHAPEP